MAGRLARRLVATLVLALVALACDAPAEPPESDRPDDPADTGVAPPEDVEPPTGDGVLHLGYLLLEDGEDLEAAQIDAVRLAVSDMNAAGGVLGADVALLGVDAIEDPTRAAEAAQRLIGEGVNAILGPAATGAALRVADAAAGAGVVQCSPANAAPEFTTRDLGGLYFRTTPSAAIQGPVLAELVAEDGHERPAILASDDIHGRGMLEAIRTALADRGIEATLARTFEPDDSAYWTEVNDLVGSGADAVIIVASDAAQLLQDLAESGLSPPNFPTYGSEGLRSDDLAEQVDAADRTALQGLRGTALVHDADPDFLTRFADETGREGTAVAAQAYDCAVIIALAAELAGTDLGPDIARRMVDVTAGGVDCDSFEACRNLIVDGRDVAYQTRSGIVLATSPAGGGEPDRGTVEVWEIDDAGAVRTVETREAALP